MRARNSENQSCIRSRLTIGGQLHVAAGCHQRSWCGHFAQTWPRISGRLLPCVTALTVPTLLPDDGVVRVAPEQPRSLRAAPPLSIPDDQREEWLAMSSR